MPAHFSSVPLKPSPESTRNNHRMLAAISPERGISAAVLRCYVGAMPSEQKPKRPFAVYCIILLELYLAVSSLYFVWKATSVLRPDVDVATGCEDARYMMSPPDDVSFCMSHGLDQAKSDVMFNGLAIVAMDVFFIVTAVGLWQLQKWARSWLAGTCVTQLAFCARWILITKAVGIPDISDHIAHYEIPEIAVTLLVLVALYSTSVPQAFGATD